MPETDLLVCFPASPPITVVCPSFEEDLRRGLALADHRRVELHVVGGAVVGLVHGQVHVAVGVDRRRDGERRAHVDGTGWSARWSAPCRSTTLCDTCTNGTCWPTFSTACMLFCAITTGSESTSDVAARVQGVERHVVVRPPLPPVSCAGESSRSPRTQPRGVGPCPCPSARCPEIPSRGRESGDLGDRDLDQHLQRPQIHARTTCWISAQSAAEARTSSELLLGSPTMRIRSRATGRRWQRLRARRTRRRGRRRTAEDRRGPRRRRPARRRRHGRAAAQSAAGACRHRRSRRRPRAEPPLRPRRPSPAPGVAARSTRTPRLDDAPENRLVSTGASWAALACFSR